jgi:hypothetical protein
MITITIEETARTPRGLRAHRQERHQGHRLAAGAERRRPDVPHRARAEMTADRGRWHAPQSTDRRGGPGQGRPSTF